METTGVSVILCCYNSSARIGETLRALSKQDYKTTLCWEIILVDNVSTDNTGEIARKIWTVFDSPIPIHIIEEPKAGLGFARKTGIAAARFSIILFCDDDNWLFPNYLQSAFEVLENDPNLAACGGKGIPVFETARPKWFREYQEAFAVGCQQEKTEKKKLSNLYGAGLVTRKRLFEELDLSGFTPLLGGRTGSKLSSAEDTELTYALVLLGYTLGYSEKLKFFHYLPKERLSQDYLTRLFIAFGEDGPIRNIYHAQVCTGNSKRVKSWPSHLLLSVGRLIKYLVNPPKKNGRLLYLKWNIAYIRKLMALRRQYPMLVNKIANIKTKTTLAVRELRETSQLTSKPAPNQDEIFLHSI